MLTEEEREAKLQRDIASLRKRSFPFDWKLGLKLFGLGVGGIAAAIVLVLKVFGPAIQARNAVQEERRRAIDAWEEQRRLAEALDPLPPPMPVEEPPPPTFAVVEYELDLGGEIIPIESERTNVLGNVPVRFEVSRDATWTSDDLSFEHPAGVRIAATFAEVEPAPAEAPPDPAAEAPVIENEATETEEPARRVESLVIETAGHGVIRMNAFAAGDDLAAIAEFVPREAVRRARAAGATREPITRWIGNDEVAGERVTTNEASVDLYAIALDETRGLGIVVEQGEPVAGQAVDRILASLWPRPRRVPGIVDLFYLGVVHPLQLDAPLAIETLPGHPTATLRRRAVVRRRWNELAIEYPASAIAWTDTDGESRWLELDYTEVDIRLSASAIDPTIARTALAGDAAHGTPVQREIAGAQRDGLQFAQSGTTTEVFAFVRGGVTLGFRARYLARARAAAGPTIASVASSIR